MGVAQGAGLVRPVRRWRTVSEKRRIAELTLEPGASVALVARAHGVNANQVFKWRRALKRGELNETGPSTSLLPVVVSASSEALDAIVEVNAEARLAIRRSDSHRVCRQGGDQRGERRRSSVVASGSGDLAQVIDLRAGTKIWLAAGVTDMRRGFDGLSAKVQTVLEQQPFSGHVFVFRGRRGDIVKLLWWDGDGLCLFAKRLERGRFIWPQATEGTVCLTRAQLSMLLEGIDWRRPERTWTPEMAV